MKDKMTLNFIGADGNIRTLSLSSFPFFPLVITYRHGLISECPLFSSPYLPPFFSSIIFCSLDTVDCFEDRFLSCGLLFEDITDRKYDALSERLLHACTILVHV